MLTLQFIDLLYLRAQSHFDIQQFKIIALLKIEGKLAGLMDVPD